MARVRDKVLFVLFVVTLAALSPVLVVLDLLFDYDDPEDSYRHRL